MRTYLVIQSFLAGNGWLWILGHTNQDVVSSEALCPKFGGSCLSSVWLEAWLF